MSQNNDVMDHEGFLDFLHESDLKREYTAEYDSLVKEIAKEFDTEEAAKFKHKDKDENISINDKYHRETLNACIYPFSQKGSLKELGYYFIRSEPLAENSEQNVDFLIASKEKGIAIFGEAKTSSANPARIIEEMNARRDVIETNRTFLNETMIPDVTHFEYVVGLPAFEARDLSAATLRQDGLEYIIWSYGGPESREVLSLYVPPGEKWDHVRRIRHGDNLLNSKLSRVPTSKIFKNFFRQSHPVAKMAVLTWIDLGKEGDSPKSQFSREELSKICSVELEGYPKHVIEREVDQIIELAIDVGFIKRLGDGIFKVTIANTDPKARYEDLKQKWIAHSIKKDRTEKLNAGLLRLQQRYRTEKSRRYPSLLTFGRAPDSR